VFRERIVPLIALRLLKDTDDPPWRVLAKIFYLGVAQDPQATVPLIRFVATTPIDRQRYYGARALRDVKDPDLVAKLRAEKQSTTARGWTWPEELETLARVRSGGS
jgi:HEAT repeat protein